MQDEALGEVSRKLDVIIKLLANQFTTGKNTTGAVAMLDKLGLTHKEISMALNEKPTTVGARLSETKKKGAK
jgi:hypothetical protein